LIGSWIPAFAGMTIGASCGVLALLKESLLMGTTG
jgi:hypothetical protein